jgi:hypothetical protein
MYGVPSPPGGRAQMCAADDRPASITACHSPWATAITAASTLIAGWGGISLKDWHDARRARQDRRRAAYLELMLRLDDLRRIFGAPQTLDERALAAGTIGKSMGQAVGEIQRAYFSVFLVAPRNVQALAGAAWDAAWKIHDWFDSGGRGPADLVS